MRPVVARAGQGVLAPGKALMTRFHSEQIGGQTGEAAITVGERMDGHKPMMEPGGDLVWRDAGVLDLCMRVVKELA